MAKFQISIRASLGLTAFFAVGCVALTKPSFLWAQVLWTFTMAALAVGIIGIACRRDRSRAFWIGFSVFGWGHMILALAPWFDDHTGEFIITRHLLDMLGGVLGHDVAIHTEMPGIWHNLPWASTGRSRSYTYLTYLVSGQSLFTLMLGTVGGYIAQYFHAREINSAGRGSR